MIKNAYYQSSLAHFKKHNVNDILGNISQASPFADEQNQKRAWKEQIESLKEYLEPLSDGHIFFEYNIPRIGKRIDNVLLYHGIIFILEFKVGKTAIHQQDINQVFDYALDLKNFHKSSHSRIIVPILIATEAQKMTVSSNIREDLVYDPIICLTRNLTKLIHQITEKHPAEPILDGQQWNNSPYYPTPTIIEAAQALYKGHNVQAISRSEASIKNLSLTTDCIEKVIDDCKKHHKKAICFITGVPGAGKTLAGLNIANRNQNYGNQELTTFLSGNGPLVDVLREALAIDLHERTKITKDNARRQVNSFIQNVHHFRDNAVKDNSATAEKVIIFDEAQRAWNLEKTSNFMNKKRNQENFNQSEPTFLISVMDRQPDWAVIICLIGDGQEINDGEAGLEEWFNSLKQFPGWEIYTPAIKLLEDNYPLSKISINKDLHLAVSIRAFRSEQLSNWVTAVLDHDKEKANELLKKIDRYPIVLTRSLDKAREWLKQLARGSERTGLVASSGAKRLKKEGIHIKKGFEVTHWFLQNKEDVRSSSFLEEVATEFDIQGLELDWACVCWDLDLRISNNQWIYKKFKGTKWQNIKKIEDQIYKKNAYRVLLTRARQGMIIYIPQGDIDDATRAPEEYEAIYQYFKSFNLQTI